MNHVSELRTVRERTSKAVPISTGDCGEIQTFLGVIMSRHNSVSSLQSHHNNPKQTRKKREKKLLLFTKKNCTQHTFKNLMSNRKASQHANTWTMSLFHPQHLVNPWTGVLVTTGMMGNYAALHYSFLRCCMSFFFDY